jgi:DNA-binding PadR family transcriptional regulator
MSVVKNGLLKKGWRLAASLEQSDYFHNTISQAISTSFKFFYNKLVNSVLYQEDLYTIGEAQMKKEDWLLVYLSLPSADNKSYIDPIRIQKGLFLFRMQNEDKVKDKDKAKDFYEFIPYLYGPCSLDIYDDLRELQQQGLVSDRPRDYRGWTYYTLTSEGEKKAKSLKGQDPNRLVGDLESIKERVTRLSFLELLQVIYAEYPKFAEESIVREAALNDVSGGVGV